MQYGYCNVKLKLAVTMSVPAASELDPLLTRQDHRKLSCCCKLSYKPRKFSSKGAMLVLVWQFLVFCGVFLGINTPFARSITGSYFAVGVILLVLAATISGWLADTKVGRSKVVQTGLFLSWLGAVLVTACNILTISVHTTSNAAIQAVQYIALYTTYAGAVIFFTNIVQFGLEQMPDASSDAMTAYITWMVIVTFLGQGTLNLTRALLVNIVNFDNKPTSSKINTVSSIVLCGFLSIAMCSKFLFGHWLIDHRQNHHPLKTVYRVLKFAKQHKYPVNRSAFTYWEEEIPSRIDLGKTKYGGPFTTEEVEDVKTFFRILAVLTVIFVFTIVTVVLQQLHEPFRFYTDYPARIIYSLHGYFTAAIFLIYEYIVHPCIKIRCFRLSMLKTIGLCMLWEVLTVVILFVYAIVKEVGLIDYSSITSREHRAIEIVWQWIYEINLFIFVKSILQFLYSQTPEQMKGIILACTSFTIPIFTAITSESFKCSQHKYCRVSVTSVALPLSLLVFVVYCCVARRYKRRERDEPCNERAIIEEIYGRHVEHNSIEEQDTD